MDILWKNTSNLKHCAVVKLAHIKVLHTNPVLNWVFIVVVDSQIIEDMFLVKSVF